MGKKSRTSISEKSRSFMITLFILGVLINLFNIGDLIIFDVNPVAKPADMDSPTQGIINNDTDVRVTVESSSHTTNSSTNLPIMNTTKQILSKEIRINDTTSSIIVKNSTDTGSTFKRYDGVVIVTKIHDIKLQWRALKGWICFINHAYNDKVKYDVVVFTTMPFEPSDIAELQEVAKPANLKVSNEGQQLEEQLAAMTKDELEFLYKRCQVKENTNLTWWHHCVSPSNQHKTNLGYSWQAEFRAYHIWNHVALKDYKYMIWLDLDAIVGREWDIDPMKIMIENDLTVMYVGYPYGAVANGSKIGKQLMEAYNTSICSVANSGKHLYAKVCKDKSAGVRGVAGNHHITNLDVFRKDVHQKFLKSFTGDYRFDRDADDQLAVTIVGVMEQYIQNNFSEVPSRYTVWHERSNGLTLKIAHHGMYDVLRHEKAVKSGRNIEWYQRRFFNKVKENWTGLEERCEAFLS